jgi:type II secretory pathway pseudopilin PulG
VTSEGSCERCDRRALTLVEVIAGLALLATLLAAVLVAFGIHAGQIRLARDRMTAIGVADRLLSDWSSQNAIPAVGTEKSLSDTVDWGWRLASIESSELAQQGLSSIRLEVFRSLPTGDRQILASVDLVVPGKGGAMR